MIRNIGKKESDFVVEVPLSRATNDANIREERAEGLAKMRRDKTVKDTPPHLAKHIKKCMNR